MQAAASMSNALKKKKTEVRGIDRCQNSAKPCKTLLLICFNTSTALELMFSDTEGGKVGEKTRPKLVKVGT